LVVEKENEPYTGNTSIAITTIKGGSAFNMSPGQTEEMVAKKIEQVLKEYKLENSKINIEMKKIRCT